MNDSYTHTDKQLIYVIENIPGPAENSGEYLELINNFNSQIEMKCVCKGICVGECLCICNSRGNNYSFSCSNDLKSYKLSSVKKKLATNAIFECNDFCSCTNLCGNKLVQKGPCDGLSVRTCEVKKKGVGLFTKYLITNGSFVCEYAGELITKSQAFKRHQLNYSKGLMNFIFCLNEHCNGKVIQTFVDPSTFGNIGRYINHSCDPNCYILPVRINSPIPKLAIFSLRDILPDQEITFDYGSNNCKNVQLPKSDVECTRKKCLCNSHNCRVILPYDSY